MNLEALSVPNSNFINLVLLVCQLFAGGRFRIAHIIHYPDTCNDRLLTQLNSACLPQIPVITSEILATNIQSNLHSADFGTHPDRFLQLIFLPQNELNESCIRIATVDFLSRLCVFRN